MSNLINNCSLNLVLIQNLLTHHKKATGFTDNIEEIYENVYHPKNITLASTKIHLYSIIEKLKITHKITWIHLPLLQSMSVYPGLHPLSQWPVSLLHLEPFIQ